MKLKILRTTLLFILGVHLQIFSLPFLEEEYQYLDGLALEAGTDISSAFHNYTRVYSQFFSDLKEAPIKFLEIGIHQGAAVKLWENYFTKASLYFIEEKPDGIKYFSERSKYYYIDQSDSLALRNFLKGLRENFDVIIDDGGHRMHQQIMSFKTLFPYLKKGGLYVIEDLHTSYWKSFGGKGSPEKPIAGVGTTVDYLKALVDDLNFVGARSQCADHLKAPSNLKKEFNYFQENIDAIHFYGSLCIIIKK
jgi:hypothetical protein